LTAATVMTIDFSFFDVEQCANDTDICDLCKNSQ